MGSSTKNKITQILGGGIKISSFTLEARRVFLFQLLSLVGIFANSLLAFFNLLAGNPDGLVIDFLFAGLFLLNLAFMKKLQDFNMTVKFGLFVTCFEFIYLIFSGGYRNTGSYWVTLFPLITVFLLDRKDSKRWLTWFIAVVFILGLSQLLGLITISISSLEVFLLLVRLFLFSMLSYFYFDVNATSEELLSTKNESLKELINNLNSNRNLLNLLIDTIDSPIYSKTKEGRYQLVNEAYARDIIGLSKENIVGKTDLELEKYLTHDVAKSYYLKDLEFMVIKSENESQDRIKVQNSSRYKDYIIRKTTLNDEHENVIGMVGVFSDISLITKSQKLIEQEKDKFITILQSIGDAVIVLDKSKKIILVNYMTEELSGYTRDELLGQVYTSKLKFVSADTKRELTSFVDRVYKQGIATSMDRNTVLIKKDGSEVAVGDSAAPIFDDKKEIVGCVVVFRDNTKEREIDKSKTEFISLVSHQLKNPITTVKWLVQLLQSTSGNLLQDQRNYLNDIIKTTGDMTELINDLLDVSRIETGRKFAVIPEPADIIKVIKDEVFKLSPHAASDNITIKFEPGFPVELVLEIDPKKVGQVFHNLLTNAVKYTNQGGEVTVGYSTNDEEIFWVKDTGIGIPKAQQKDIFTKFFRASNTSILKKEGSGLGLYIVKSIMSAHRGTVWFESEEGAGTTFYVAFPKSAKRRLKGKLKVPVSQTAQEQTESPVELEVSTETKESITSMEPKVVEKKSVKKKTVKKKTKKKS